MSVTHCSVSHRSVSSYANFYNEVNPAIFIFLTFKQSLMHLDAIDIADKENREPSVTTRFFFSIQDKKSTYSMKVLIRLPREIRVPNDQLFHRYNGDGVWCQQ